MRLLHYLLFFLLLPSSIFASIISEDRQQMFIETWSLHAVHEMNRSGVPASITLAQAILESQWGQSEAALQANNYFGIKCYNGWSGGTFYKWDDETTPSCFRSYGGVEESFKDHSDFLRNNPRYAKLFEHSSTDYKNWAKTLKSCGYATAESYAEKLIELIEKHGLFMYDYATPAQPLKAFEEEKHNINIIETPDPAVINNVATQAPSITEPMDQAHLAVPVPQIQQPNVQEPQTTTGSQFQPVLKKPNVKAKTYLPTPEYRLERR